MATSAYHFQNYFHLNKLKRAQTNMSDVLPAWMLKSECGWIFNFFDLSEHTESDIHLLDLY